MKSKNTQTLAARRAFFLYSFRVGVKSNPYPRFWRFRVWREASRRELRTRGRNKLGMYVEEISNKPGSCAAVYDVVYNVPWGVCADL